MGDERRIEWKDLGAAERLKLIEQVWQGRVTKSELCRTFHMSRQVLHRAMVAAKAGCHWAGSCGWACRLCQKRFTS